MKHNQIKETFAQIFNKELWAEIWEKIDNKRVLTLLLVVLFCLVFLPGITIYDMIHRLQEDVSAKQAQIEELTTTNQALVVENEELQASVQVLSSTVNLQAQTEEERQEEVAKLSMPTEFPVTGKVSMLEVTQSQIDAKQQEAANAEEGQEVEQLASDKPIMIFTVTDINSGSSVIAAGSGTVTAVEEDPLYGKVVEIDHGNGYVSYYRNAGAAKVAVGDNVTRGTVLFVVGANNNIIGFQITLDGQYIDPAIVVDIAG